MYLKLTRKIYSRFSWFWVSFKVTNRLFTSTRVAVSGGAVVTDLNAVTSSVTLVLAKVSWRSCKLVFWIFFGRRVL